MKKILLFSATLLQLELSGQAVPNGDFENWTTTAYNDPTGFNTGNIRDIQRMGVTSVTKVTGYSGFGLRIQTMIANGDTSESYIINTNNPCSNPSQWTGGIPYAQQPTAITGRYRYNLPGNDTALMVVIFRKNGAHIGDNYIKIRGTGSQSTWALFSFPVACAGVPDTMIFAAASSNKISNVGIMNGSYLELDDLGFAGTTQPFPNGMLENWNALSNDLANGWAVDGEAISRSASSYSGNYAIRLQSVGTCGNTGIRSSMITTGRMIPNNGPAGGLPYTGIVDTLFGYYMYTSMGGDSAQIGVTVTKLGNPVGGNWVKLPAAANYILFKIPFSASITPDTIRIDAVSSKWPSSIANIGSTLYLDNLYLKSQPLGVSAYNKDEKVVLFPNPVSQMLTIFFPDYGKRIVSVYSVLGQEIYSELVYGNNLSFDVSSLTAGVYLIRIERDGKTVTKKFVKQ